jgi:hypothetical protein
MRVGVHDGVGIPHDGDMAVPARDGWSEAIPIIAFIEMMGFAGSTHPAS